MANILTGSFGNANEQVFYGNAGAEKMDSAQMIFPNGAKGTIGGGEFVTVTKYMTGLFGEQYPYTTVEFVPNKVVAIKRADERIADNIAYDGDGSAMKTGLGFIGGNVGVAGEAKPMAGGWGFGQMQQKSCPAGWRDDGLMCSEPLETVCDEGVLQNGLCVADRTGMGFKLPVGVPRITGGRIQSKF
jgi:hypothetical protein